MKQNQFIALMIFIPEIHKYIQVLLLTCKGYRLRAHHVGAIKCAATCDLP